MKPKTLFYSILLTIVTSLIPAAHAQTFSVIKAFSGGTDGEFPYAGVTIRENALYGTTYGNPYENNCGTGRVAHISLLLGNVGTTILPLTTPRAPNCFAIPQLPTEGNCGPPVQQMLGHAKLSSTQIHTQVSIRMLKHVHAATHPKQLQKSEPLAKEGTASGDLSKEELFAALALEAEEENQEKG